MIDIGHVLAALTFTRSSAHHDPDRTPDAGLLLSGRAALASVHNHLASLSLESQFPAAI